MDIPEALRKLNRIEHLLDTIEYSPSVPVMEWYSQRDTIIQSLESLGLEVQQEDVLIGNARESRYVVFAKGMAEGFPEKWAKE